MAKGQKLLPFKNFWWKPDKPLIETVAGEGEYTIPTSTVFGLSKFH